MAARWKDGFANGCGIYTSKLHTIYKGTFKNGVVDGKNMRIQYYDGTVYAGEIKQGYYCGQGKLVYTNGDMLEGTWLNNEMHGTGIAQYSDGEIYTGEFCNGDRHGYGECVWQNGNWYKGGWSKDTLHGYGYLSAINTVGKIYDSNWIYGCEQ
ncbi:MAG: hypothetical protein WCJ72_12090 [Chryseobacterium sp.]